MDTATESKRRNRFVVEPRADEPYRLTDKDIAILNCLQYKRYLPTSWLHALCGGSDITRFKKRLTKLRHNARLIDAHWAGHNALYQEAVYSLSGRPPHGPRLATGGYAELVRRGLFVRRPTTGSEFHHELMVCITQASFELGIKEHGLDLITATDILEHPACPVRTRHMKSPFTLPVEFDYQHEGKKHPVKTTVETDGDFFGVARPVEDGRVSLIIPGFEADRRTEPLEPEDYDRPSIKKKFLAYRQLAREQAYQRRFGFDNFVIPFITINEAHMRSLMRVLENVTNGKGSTLFIFKAMPNFAAFDKFPKPGGFMLTEPWKRVGHPDFDILVELHNG